ncbi:MAG: BtpA/SgcQ family protein [Treponema sp.]|nr:BtpA/SgcQ family protein [Treponema sp.]
MKRNLLSVFPNKKPIIGMIHLRPLPGSPLYDPFDMGMKKIIQIALEEAEKLQDAGVDGLQVENIWDYPYQKQHFSEATVASLAVAVSEVSSKMSIPVGVNCHMNGAPEAMACAVAGNAKWIRVFEWCNAFISQVGFVDSTGADTARLRSSLKADDIMCLCDVNVKHGSHYIIHDRTVAEQAADVESEGGDAVIVTGFDTGMPPTPEKVAECKKAVTLPVLLGSGVTEENACSLLSIADGAIIGSWFKEGNKWKNPVSYERARSFMKEMEKIRKE